MTFTATAGAALPAIVVVFAVTAILAYGLTPLVRRFADRVGMVDRPNHRRVNVHPVPRGGGLAVAGAFVPVAVATIFINRELEIVTQPPTIDVPQLVALLAGGAAAAVVGAADDYLELRARWQLAGQVVLATAAALVGGLAVTTVNNPLGPETIELAGPFAIAFSVVWIVGMINSINFIDGLDGLSSGIGVIAAVTLGIISLTAAIGQPLVAILCAALAGSLLGFLRWNFHPATIFVGTSGVMFLGYTLALLSILGTAKVAVALLVLGVPIIDTFWIIVRRLATGRSPFTPDRGHIHHRLLDLGLTHNEAVILIYGICTLLAVLSFSLSGTGQLYAFLGVLVVSGLGLFILTRRSLVAEELQAESYPNGEHDHDHDHDRAARPARTVEPGREHPTA